MSEEKVEQGCEQEALWHVMNLPIKVEQPKVGELPELVVTEADWKAVEADGTDGTMWKSSPQTKCRERQLLAEQQVSAGLREDLEQLRSLAKTKEVCGHSTSWQCAGEGGFYCLMCRAEAAEASLAEAIAQRDEAKRKLAISIGRQESFKKRVQAAEARLAAFTCVNPKE